LAELPIKHNKFDDTSKKNRTKEATSLTWPCNNLSEIDLDNNQLKSLPFQLFQLKSLKHLNVSGNKLAHLPEEVWEAPSLVELNASFNLLSSLPIASKKSIAQSCSFEKELHAQAESSQGPRKSGSQQKSRAKKSDPEYLLTGEVATAERVIVFHAHFF
jgi:hypothetical protein